MHFITSILAPIGVKIRLCECLRELPCFDRCSCLYPNSSRNCLLGYVKGARTRRLLSSGVNRFYELKTIDRGAETTESRHHSFPSIFTFHRISYRTHSVVSILVEHHIIQVRDIAGLIIYKYDRYSSLGRSFFLYRYYGKLVYRQGGSGRLN